MWERLIIIAVVLLFNGCGPKEKTTISRSGQKKKTVAKREFGFTLDHFEVFRDTVKRGDTFGEILLKHHLNYGKVHQIAKAAKDSFDIRKIKPGRAYTILKNKDSLNLPVVFIYQHDMVHYVVVDFRNDITVLHKKKAVKTVEKEASGVILSSLFEAMTDKEIDLTLAYKMSEIYAWVVDFFRLQKNDTFKIIYEQRFINDTVSVGTGAIKAACLEHRGKAFYAFLYNSDTTSRSRFNYYDEEGNSLQRTFLKSPVKFSRISSHYSKRRFHPILKRRIPHLGTDYAAPRGTPVRTTADGVVIRAGYTRTNGNYVKIKHNSIYTTQYLHLHKIKRNITRGTTIKQGDIIGYVGSTGLATGPHVCYRFWKNGKQVNALKQKLPISRSIKETLKPEYLGFVSPLKRHLDSLNAVKPPTDAVVSKDSIVIN